MAQQGMQRELRSLYDAWKAGLDSEDPDAAIIGPPYLLSVTDDYARATRRVLVIGKEDNGWEWSGTLRTEYPEYPNDYPYEALKTWKDYLDYDDANEALMWAYEQFQFASRQPNNRSSAFWSTFREIAGWPSVGVMSTNLDRATSSDCNYRPVPNYGSRRKFLRRQEGDLLAREIKVLKPDICIFFAGDKSCLIDEKWPGVRREVLGGSPERVLAKLVHNDLPVCSYVTYHPNARSNTISPEGKALHLRLIKENALS